MHDETSADTATAIASSTLTDGAPIADGAGPDLPALSGAALFLDFDGCLVDIVDTPDAVRVPAGLPDLLERLHRATGGKVWLVSGRKLDDLEKFLPDFPGDLVGSHGGEFRVDGTREPVEGAGGEDFARIRDELRDWVADRDGLLLEEKPVSLVLHYRRAQDLEPECRARIEDAAGRLDGYECHPSKMVYELKPAAATKGAAVTRLLDGPAAGRRPVAAGDDVTDEAMIAVAEDRGGLGIRVGDGETRATHRVSGPDAMRGLLGRWLEQEG